jgi:aspartate/methionine/tyrosine aminotransferase
MSVLKNRLNSAITNLIEPPIPMVLGWADMYNGGHGPMLNLSQAVPGYPAHPDIFKWLSEAASDPEFSSYGEVKGDAGLRTNLANHISDLYQTTVQQAETQITAGCNQAFYAAAITLFCPGDKVLLTNPCFFNHEYTLQMLGLEAGFVDCRPEDSFLPTLEGIEAGIISGAKGLVLVSPNNPTGTIYPATLLDGIFDLCEHHGVWLLVDETYRDFRNDQSSSPHGLFQQPDWQNTLIQLYSFSKAYCVPGHRVGAITAHKDICEEIEKAMDNLQICAPRAAQYAVAQGLEKLRKWRQGNAAEIQRRGQAFIDVISAAPEWQIAASGAYFAYIKHPFDEQSSLTVTERLAKTFGVLGVPGEFFGKGQEPFIRFSYANVDVEGLAPLAERLNACFKTG